MEGQESERPLAAECVGVSDAPAVAVAAADESPVSMDLSKYDWQIRHRKCGKFDGKCFEGRLVHPYNGQDVTCFAETLPLLLEELQRCAFEAEEAQAKYMKGRKKPADDQAANG